jgi:DUF4097 and DUF4098 domain-containing protein YvlB
MPKIKKNNMLIVNNRAAFNTTISLLVNKTDMNYLEAIIHYCEDNNLEIETVKGLISADNKERLRDDAEKLNFFPKTSKLPI